MTHALLVWRILYQLYLIKNVILQLMSTNQIESIELEKHGIILRDGSILQSRRQDKKKSELNQHR